MKTFYIENDTLRMTVDKLEPKSAAEAIELSIERHEVTLEWHKKNEGKLPTQKWTTLMCGLCVWNGATPSENQDCNKCALHGLTGNACHRGTVYQDYAENPCEETSAAMVAALKSLRPDWVKRLAERPRWKLIGIDWAEGAEELRGDSDVVVEPPDYGEDWWAHGEKNGDMWIRDDGEEYIALMYTGLSEGRARLLRTRIIACVKACKGMTNEELENGVDTLGRLKRILERLNEARPEGSHHSFRMFSDGSGRILESMGSHTGIKDILAGTSADILRQLEEYVEKK